MSQFYAKMILLHELVVPLVGIQKKTQEVLNTLKVENMIVDQHQEWDTKYPYFLQ